MSEYDKHPTDPHHGGKLSFHQMPARIRELEALLDECEQAFQEIINSGGYRGSVAHAEFVDALSIRVLHKLRAAQENADD